MQASGQSTWAAAAARTEGGKEPARPLACPRSPARSPADRARTSGSEEIAAEADRLLLPCTTGVHPGALLSRLMPPPGAASAAWVPAAAGKSAMKLPSTHLQEGRAPLSSCGSRQSLSSWRRLTASSRPAKALGSTTPSLPAALAARAVDAVVASVGVDKGASSANVRATASAISAYHDGSASCEPSALPGSRRRKPNDAPSPCSCSPGCQELLLIAVPLLPVLEAGPPRKLTARTVEAVPEAAARRASSSARERRTDSAISTATAASVALRPCNVPRGVERPRDPAAAVEDRIQGLGSRASSRSMDCRQTGQVAPRTSMHFSMQKK